MATIMALTGSFSIAGSNSDGLLTTKFPMARAEEMELLSIERSFAALDEIETWSKVQSTQLPETARLKSDLRELLSHLLSPHQSTRDHVLELVSRIMPDVPCEQFPVLIEMTQRYLAKRPKFVLDFSKVATGHNQTDIVPQAKTVDEQDDEDFAKAIELSLGIHESQTENKPEGEETANASQVSDFVQLPDEDQGVQQLIAASKEIGAYMRELQEVDGTDLPEWATNNKILFIAWDVADMITFDRGDHMSVTYGQYTAIKSSIIARIENIPAGVLERLPKLVELIQSYPPLASTVPTSLIRVAE